MYFKNFPLTYYTLDDNRTVQVVTNTFLRTIFTEELKNNYTVYDEYDIVDGETPEIVAYKVYGNSELHWIVLMLNDVIDPRYDWLLSQSQLKTYVESKYGSLNSVHHYEDSNGNTVSGNISFTASVFSGYSASDVVYNQSAFGQGFVTSKPSSSEIIVTVTKGGFQNGDVISNNAQGTNKVSITGTTIISGTAVTNLIHEGELNEEKRRIRLLKPQFVQKVISEFESKMSQINV